MNGDLTSSPRALPVGDRHHGHILRTWGMETVVEFFLLSVTLRLLIFTTSMEKAYLPLWGLYYLLFQLVFFIHGTSGYLFKFIKSWVADSVFQSALHHIYEYALAKLSNYKLKKKNPVLSCLIHLQVLLLPPEDLLNLLTLLHYHHCHLLPDHCNSLLIVLVVITLSFFPIFLFSTI